MKSMLKEKCENRLCDHCEGCMDGIENQLGHDCQTFTRICFDKAVKNVKLWKQTFILKFICKLVSECAKNCVVTKSPFDIFTIITNHYIENIKSELVEEFPCEW